MLRHPARLPGTRRLPAPLAAARCAAAAGLAGASRLGAQRVETRDDRARPRRSSSARRKGGRVDALCVGYGFRPNAELGRLLGCTCRLDPASGDLVPVTDAWGRTSIPTIFMAGEAMGIAGIHAARVRGMLAAEAIRAALGLRRSRLARTARLCSAKHRRSLPLPSSPTACFPCRSGSIRRSQMRRSSAAASRLPRRRCAGWLTHRAMTSMRSRLRRARDGHLPGAAVREYHCRAAARGPGRRGNLPAVAFCRACPSSRSGCRHRHAHDERITDERQTGRPRAAGGCDSYWRRGCGRGHGL